MEHLISPLIGFVRAVIASSAPSLLRRRWTAQRLAEKINIDISSEHTGIDIHAGELPKFQAFIKVSNFSPFTIEVDRLWGDLNYAGSIGSFVWLERTTIAPSTFARVHVQADMTDAQVRHLQRVYGTNNIKASLSVNGYFVCPVRGFQVLGRNITSTNVEVKNLAPLPSAKAQAS